MSDNPQSQANQTPAPQPMPQVYAQPMPQPMPQMYAQPGVSALPMSPKKRSTYLLLWLFFGFGVLGIQNFYIDRSGRGFLELVTGGGCGILALLDLFTTTDGFGRQLR